jgi:hypothetical protein
MSCKKWIYSDCYSSYQFSDFSELGYILKRVNNSVWLGYISFHTNMVGLYEVKRYIKISLDYL